MRLDGKWEMFLPDSQTHTCSRLWARGDSLEMGLEFIYIHINFLSRNSFGGLDLLQEASEVRQDEVRVLLSLSTMET